MLCETADFVDGLDGAVVGAGHLEAVGVQDPADPVDQVQADLRDLELLVDEGEHVLHPGEDFFVCIALVRVRLQREEIVPQFRLGKINKLLL